MREAVADLLSYLDGSPTPYHAAAESARRLESAGFRALAERDIWRLESGERAYVIRGEGSVVAFEVGLASPADAGFRIVGAHTDSPNLRLKPVPDLGAHGYRQLGVEPYGGVLLHTWLDRDLSLAGRVTAHVAGALETLLVDFRRPLFRIPSLAIHLNRDVNSAGLVLNAQTHLAPLTGLDDAPPLAELVAAELASQSIARVGATDLLAFDLMLYDSQPADLIGAREELVVSARLDNLGSCHAATTALARTAGVAAPFTRLVVLYDHEEVGSRTAQGAAGPFLAQVVERIVDCFEGADAQGTPRALARSTMISADMAHALHPNYADRHEPSHRPILGRGPVIKVNAGQAYATDAYTAGLFAALCRSAGSEPQRFVVRSDLPCGSTIGPITAARLGVRTVDVGSPMLSMHSCREVAAAADVPRMIDVLAAYFEAR